ncbi:hypothetical protein DWY99_00420 [[Clostridium] leptum]|uniref:Uncharacterized protein n=1 Tax=[Clostridium] leptum TaxID=1535 RepID=A0A412B1E2_9FIRM|nr:hypothetical protein DWY99_00420 [[Clostridium] leptum]
MLLSSAEELRPKIKIIRSPFSAGLRLGFRLLNLDFPVFVSCLRGGSLSIRLSLDSKRRKAALPV